MKVRIELAAALLAVTFAAGGAVSPAEARQAPDGVGFAMSADHGGVGLGAPNLATVLKETQGASEAEERIELAQRYRGRRGRSRGRDVGAGVAIGLGAAIIGSLIATERARAYEDEIEEAIYDCHMNYRSFDERDGTVVLYSGEVVICPYLRPYVD